MNGRTESAEAGDRTGFTLIEMLISMAIFGVVTAFVMANYRAGQQGDELRIASQLVASSVRRAQTAAIAGQTVFWCNGGSEDLKLCPSGDDLECGGGTCTRGVPRGFGLHLSSAPGESRTVIMFADIDGDKRFDQGEAMRADNISPGPFVVIDSLSPESVGLLDIAFTPPKPSITYNATTSTVVASITLRHTNTGATKAVTVNGVSGQVSAE